MNSTAKDLLQKILQKGFSNLKILVLGSGVTGAAGVEVFNKLGVNPEVCSSKDFSEEKKNYLRYKPIAEVEVLEYSKQDQNYYDFILISPGINPNLEFIKQLTALHPLILSDLDVAWLIINSEVIRDTSPEICVITGTNGKTTATSMVQHILQKNALKAIACGNIGYSIIKAVYENKQADYLVVEASSFQLYWSKLIEFDYGILLNIDEDHLDFHNTIENYIETKMRVLAAKKAALISFDDNTCFEIYSEPDTDKKHLYTFSSKYQPKNGFYPNLATVKVGEVVLNIDSNTIEAKMLAMENFSQNQGLLQDALAATFITYLLGLSFAKIDSALLDYTIEPHRFDIFKIQKGISFIDDSKATNPHATKMAFSNLTEVLWIGGGLSKGLAIADLLERVSSRISGYILFGKDLEKYLEPLKKLKLEKLAYVVVLPEQAIEISRNFPLVNLVVLDRVSSEKNMVGELVMEKVADLVMRLIKELPIKNVLFSPAAASMDMFENYNERGRIFMNSINAKLGKQRNNNEK